MGGGGRTRDGAPAEEGDRGAAVSHGTRDLGGVHRAGVGMVVVVVG